jgi:hypothetical protein
MNAGPGPGPRLKAFRIELIAGEEMIGAYVVYGESILDAIGRGNLRMFDRARADKVDRIVIVPLPVPE